MQSKKNIVAVDHTRFVPRVLSRYVAEAEEGWCTNGDHNIRSSREQFSGLSAAAGRRLPISGRDLSGFSGAGLGNANGQPDQSPAEEASRADIRH